MLRANTGESGAPRPRGRRKAGRGECEWAPVSTGVDHGQLVLAAHRRLRLAGKLEGGTRHASITIAETAGAATAPSHTGVLAGSAAGGVERRGQVVGQERGVQPIEASSPIQPCLFVKLRSVQLPRNASFCIRRNADIAQCASRSHRCNDRSNAVAAPAASTVNDFVA